MPHPDDETEIPVYEIDPKKKYALVFSRHLSMEEAGMVRERITKWLHDEDMPFLIIDGTQVKLIKVQDAEKV